MRSLLDFMYKGEVNVGQSSLPMFLKTAESLQVCSWMRRFQIILFWDSQIYINIWFCRYED